MRRGRRGVQDLASSGEREEGRKDYGSCRSNAIILLLLVIYLCNRRDYESEK